MEFDNLKQYVNKRNCMKSLTDWGKQILNSGQLGCYCNSYSLDLKDQSGSLNNHLHIEPKKHRHIFCLRSSSWKRAHIDIHWRRALESVFKKKKLFELCTGVDTYGYVWTQEGLGEVKIKIVKFIS